MSKYTMQTRYVCENLIGVDESAGYESVDSIVTQAAPLVFDFHFPIFDENYRLPLEKKILKHYYTREIGEETVGLWKLRLENKLNEIMPYYNRLYQSELITFNPLYDTDLTTTHKKDFEEVAAGNRVTDSTDNIDRELNRDTTENYNGERDTVNNTQESGNKNVNGTIHEVETTEDTGNEDSTQERVYQETKNGSERNTTTMSGGHNIATNQNTTQSNTGREDRVDNSTGTENRTDSKNENKNFSADGTKHSTEEASARGWDLFADTPQGGVDIFGTDVTGAPSVVDGHETVQGQCYLTTARRTLNDSDREYDETTQNQGTETTITTGTGNTQTTGNKTGNTQTTGNMQGNTVGNEAKTKNESTTENKESEYMTNGTENITGHREFTENGERVNDNEHQENTATEHNIDFTGRMTDENRRDSDMSETEGTEKVGHENVDTTNNINNTEDYLQHIVGKRGNASYSELIVKFRETFLRTDEMLIEELNVCFFGLW